MRYHKTIGIFTVKKVVHYQNRYYTYGGFGVFLSEISKYFTKTILVAHISHAPPPDGYYELTIDGLEFVYLYQSRNEFQNLLQQPFNFFKAKRRINDMDIVLCRVPDYTGIIGIILSKLYHKEYFVQTIADWGLEAQKTSVFKKFGLGFFLKIDYYVYDVIERLAAKNSLVFAQGESSYLKHFRSSHAKLITSTAHFSSDVGVIRRKFMSETEVNVLHVGRLTGVKNQRLIIEAIAELNRITNISWNLKIIGEGPLRRNLQKQIDTLRQSEYISLVGQVARNDDFWRFYDEADIFLMSSKSEGTPKVILEAMARSLPVVAPRVGGIPYLIENDVRGLLYSEGDLRDFMSAILKMKNNVIDREKMILNAFEFSKENTVENSVQYMIKEVAAFFKWKE
jgi:glycosyltransferase involved in cell wall biosynthesis